MSDMKTGPARETIDLSELQKLQHKHTIITDDRRRRPLWFDGRFLDAQALNAEQNYFLARQSDFGRVAGAGVIEGLGVKVHPEKSRTVFVEAGHGLTPAGTQVVLPNRISVDLAAVAETQQLDASFGISSIPKQPPHNRTGIYIVALRSVEYTGNKIASYPTHVDAKRTTHDGSVIEATAVTLIPYPDAGAGTELDQRRKHVAQEIFVDGSRKGQPEDVLPLAMLALDHGVIKWLDIFMVRREIGHRERDLWGLGLSPRPLRAAHLQQYGAHLEDIENRQGTSARFSAADYFTALPPAGPMPVSGINGEDFSHTFFPAEMDVELSIVPEDELPAMIEESMVQPALDLSLTGDAQESTSVMVVMPVPRHELRTLNEKLSSLRRALPAAQPGMIAKRKPISALTQLLARRKFAFELPQVVTADSTWREELGKQPRLWYLRRRNLHYKAEVTSVMVEMLSTESEIEDLLSEHIGTLNLRTRFNALLNRGTRMASAELTSFMASSMLRKDSGVATRAVVAELEKAETLDRLEVLKVAERFSDPSFGEGIARIENSGEGLAGSSRVMDNVAKSGLLPELDRISRTLPESELNVLTNELLAVGSANNAEAVEKVKVLIAEKVAASGKARPRGPVVTRPSGTARMNIVNGAPGRIRG